MGQANPVHPSLPAKPQLASLPPKPPMPFSNGQISRPTANISRPMASTGFRPRSLMAHPPSTVKRSVQPGFAKPSAILPPHAVSSLPKTTPTPVGSLAPTVPANGLYGLENQSANQWPQQPPNQNNYNPQNSPTPFPPAPGMQTQPGGGYPGGASQQAPYLQPPPQQPYGVNQAQTDYNAQVAQWQSAYYGGGGTASASVASPNGAPTESYPTNFYPGYSAQADSSAQQASKQTSSDINEETHQVVRSGGGKTWVDPKLLEWDPTHFRLFVGNLAGDVTDEMLLKAFSKYPSVSKARVVRSKPGNKSKGYGFVAFADSDDYFRAFKEMQGKYIGSHPVKIDKANSNIAPIEKKQTGSKHNGQNYKHKKKPRDPLPAMLASVTGLPLTPTARSQAASNGVVKATSEPLKADAKAGLPPAPPRVNGAHQTMTQHASGGQKKDKDPLGPKKAGVKKKSGDKGRTRNGLKILG